VVRSGQAKVVFLAPDVETSDALTAELERLVSLAKSTRIPTVSCLNRRKLGKAVGKSMRQVAVAVCNADGVFELYRDIVRSCGLEVVRKNEY